MADGETSSDGFDSGTPRLWCRVCDSSVSVTREDSDPRSDADLKLVCPCVSDGRITAVVADDLFQPVIPHGWEFSLSREGSA